MGWLECVGCCGLRTALVRCLGGRPWVVDGERSYHVGCICGKVSEFGVKCRRVRQCRVYFGRVRKGAVCLWKSKAVGSVMWES